MRNERIKVVSFLYVVCSLFGKRKLASMSKGENKMPLNISVRGCRWPARWLIDSVTLKSYLAEYWMLGSGPCAPISSCVVTVKVVSDSLRPHGLYSPWNSPSQNTGVGRLSLPSPGDLPNPGIEPRSPALQADSLPAEPQGEPKNTGGGVVYPFSRGSSQPRNQTRVSCIAGGFFTNWAIREAQAVWYKQGFELLSFFCQRVIFTLLLCFSPYTVIKIPSNTESIGIYCMKCHNLQHLLTIRMGKWGWTCWRKRLEVKTMKGYILL